MTHLLALTATLATVVLSDDPGADAAKAYGLDASASTASAKVGESGKLVLAIRLTAPGWHVHPQAPLKIRFEGPESMKIEKAVLARRDAVDPKAEEPRFESAFVASAAGSQDAKALVDFFICSDTACVKQTRTVAIPVSVN